MIVLVYFLLHSCMSRIHAPCGSTIGFVDAVVVSIIGSLFISVYVCFVFALLVSLCPLHILFRLSLFACVETFYESTRR